MTEKKGRGVFTKEPIPKGTVIEVAPVILVNKNSEKKSDSEIMELIDNTTISHYNFAWEADSSAIALGFGSLYNHSYAPNARFYLNKTRVAFKERS